jgi:hypothetical protein
MSSIELFTMESFSGKGKEVPVNIMKAYKGRRGITLLILNASTRWK